MTAQDVKPSEPTAPVGEEIRRLRRSRKMSTTALSQRAGVSVGMISQIERGISNPSLRILTQIAEALGVQVSVLMEGSADAGLVGPSGDAVRAKQSPPALSERDFIRRKAARPNFIVSGSGFYKELLSPAGAEKLQMMLIAMPPGSRSDDMIYGNGEKAGIVIEGVLTLEVEGQVQDLIPGDSFQFDAARGHVIFNRTDETVRLYWFISLDRYPQI